MKIQYNLVKPHMSLNGQTPTQATMNNLELGKNNG